MCVLTNWTFRQAPIQQHHHHPATSLGAVTWYNSVPHEPAHQIHVDLLYNNLIPNPFMDKNELNVSWVSELTWEYRCLFDALDTHENEDQSEFAYLLLDQLDTDAEVELNDKVVLQSTNAFQKHRISVNLSSHNELKVRLKSGMELGKKLESKYGAHECWNGDCSRVYVRKPQFQYGWDWGPRLITCGFNEIVLVTSNYIEDLYIRYELNEKLNVAYVWFEVESILLAPVVQARIEIELNEKTIGVVEVNRVRSRMNISHVLENIQLWSPFRHGEPTLYSIKVFFDDELMISKTVGFRKVELITESDTTGSSFYFKVNNKPIQMLGSNWIPPHSFTSKVTQQDYETYIGYVVDSNQNMIRVWGGGQYEKDIFYQLCDARGILVWQDFMFACGIYPNEPFANSIKPEVEYQVKRLRNFASVVIYAGNNEDYQIADALNLDTNNSSQFPAKYIYEDVIPQVLDNLTSRKQVAYRFGSPYSDSLHSSYDLRFGDSHQWDVWHGRELPYQSWRQLSARFISEFGMLALPSYSTFHKYITNVSELYPDSEMIDFHTRAANKENLHHYVWSNLNKPKELDLQNWIYLTQLMQSEAVSFAFRYWRRKWDQFQVGGVLVWQLNDCWPSVSWSVIGFDQVPKLSYYGMKRELSEVSVAGYRSVVGGGVGDGAAVAVAVAGQSVLQEPEVLLDVWGFGGGKGLTLSVQLYNVDGVLVDEIEQRDVAFEENHVNAILTGATFVHLKVDTIVYLRLLKEDVTLARSSDWPQPLKNLNWEKLTSDLQIELRYLGLGEYRASTNKPVKGLQLYFDTVETDYTFSDNGIDLFPGDPQILEVVNLQEEDVEKVKYRYLHY
ncbi:mndB [Candida theae]|uniref:beta-mannosidase n=1 Tax=Candida theae TaxID=1198502 RepID=A0AAD5FW23_9ASCO|nr:mndB [Candida theae]KAI5948745.1 mndB [Candida theae]